MSIPILPKGFHPQDWDDYGGYWVNPEEPEEKILTKQCECGTNIAMGYNVPPELHQPYCPLVRKDDPS